MENSNARFKRILTISLVALMALGLMIACQQMPLDPMNSPDQTQAARYQAVPVNPEYLGLAKTAISDAEFIDVEEGGTLGGYETEYNYVEIPSNTLQEDANLQFTLEYIDDPSDSLYGALTYEVVEVINDSVMGHVQFKPETASLLYIMKDWLDGTPTAVKHDETGEIVEGVVDAGEYWMIEVPHFSRWGWMFLSAETELSSTSLD